MSKVDMRKIIRLFRFIEDRFYGGRVSDKMLHLAIRNFIEQDKA